MDVSKSLETIEELGELGADAIALYKAVSHGGIGWFKAFQKVLELGADVKALADAPEALPELKDLDINELGQLGAAGLAAAKKVIDALKA